MNSEILRAFGIDPDTKNYTFGSGHINDTYAVETQPRSVIQRINTTVFTDPDGLMNNVKLVTDFLRERIVARGGDPMRETLTVIPTADGQLFYRDKDGECWRRYWYIEHTHSFDLAQGERELEQCGYAFGNFQQELADFAADSLVETIPHFHDTVSRFAAFKKAIADDVCGRVKTAKEEIDFVLAREAHIREIMAFYTTLPLRVTHNDTKLNNVLFDETTGETLCVIDLDTVMPGYAANDFGDCVRFGASTAAEDEKDLSKVHFDLGLYRACERGFLRGFGPRMTEGEKESLKMGAFLMTIECGMRFLTDYLSGDTYFKTAYPEHNLVRCRTHVKLIREIEEKLF